MSLFFVGGSQRSGTSLMLKILCDEPSVHPYFGECSYLSSLVQAYNRGKNNMDELQYCFETPDKFRLFHRGLIQSFFQYLNNRFSGTSHLVFKEPHMTMFFPVLFELFPESKFVVMVRDPRDVLASMLTVAQKMTEKGFQGKLNQSQFTELIREFKRFYLPMYNACLENPQFRSQVLFIHYEKLVSQPEKTFQKLREFTELELPNAGKQIPGQRSIKTTNSERQIPWQTELSTQAISDSKVKNYLKVLSAEQIQLIEQHCQDYFRIFKYQPESIV